VRYFIYGLGNQLFIPQHGGARVVYRDSAVEMLLAVLLADVKKFQSFINLINVLSNDQCFLFVSLIFNKKIIIYFVLNLQFKMFFYLISLAEYNSGT